MDIQAKLKDIEDSFESESKLMLGYPLKTRLDFKALSPFLSYMINNIGDPFVGNNYHINTLVQEREVLKIFADMWGLNSYWGYISNGGTESNLQSLLMARDKFKNEATFYFSEYSHYSIKKSVNLLNVKYEIIPTKNSQLDIEMLSKKLHDAPAVVIANLGTTRDGACDDILGISKLLESRHVPYHMHCDAALSGIYLPLVSPNYSFGRMPIDTIAISGHKFLGTPMPCGIMLSTKQNTNEYVDYIHSNDTTISGSRNGLSVLCLWYALQRTNLLKEALECIDKARWLAERLHDSILYENSTIVLFRQPNTKVIQKWQLPVFEDKSHIVISPHVTQDMLDEFLRDLQ